MLNKNLERAVKRDIYAQQHVFRVHACPGMVEETRKELEMIQNSSFLPQKFQTQWAHERGQILVARMPLRNAIEVLYRVRSATGVYWELAHKRLSGVAEFKRFLAGIRWELYIPEGAFLSLGVSSFSSRLYHEGMIKDLTREVLEGKNLTISEDGEFHIHIESRDNKVAMNLGLHGDPLQHRGFRKGLVHAAPMAEHISAAATQWVCAEYSAKPAYVYAPFCGSGTLAFEYVNEYYDIPNCNWDRSYTAEKLICFPEETGAFLRRKMKEKIATQSDSRSFYLQFLDWQKDALQVSEQAWTQMKQGLGEQPIQAEFSEGDFFNWEPKTEAQIFIPLNPPFGERLALADVPSFYHRIGRRLVELKQAHRFIGYIFVPSEEAWHSFLSAIKGLQFKTRRLMHGGLDLRLVAFAVKND